jgi:hypothetical protein
LVYVSLSPGTVPDAVTPTITNRASGGSVTTAIVNGGFDPVSIEANVGDTLDVVITRPASETPIRAVLRVDGTRRPRIVRTNPPHGGRDVPLNATVVVIFSAPMDSATVNPATVQLLLDATRVSGSVGLTDDAQLQLQLQPGAMLTPLTTYTLVVSQTIRDVNGVTLDSTTHVSFTTGTAAPPSAADLIAFQSSRGIETIRPDGTGRTLLIADPAVFQPAWSPNGTRLAFTRTTDGWNNCEIYTARADGSGQQQITTPLTQPWCANSPAWSPDGRKIAFAGGPAGGCGDTPRCFGQNVYVVDADGTNARELFSFDALPPITEFPNMLYVLLAAPTWSPNGTNVVFECWAYGFGPGPDYFNFLCSGNADGSGATRLLGCCPMAPAWSPDGFQIAGSDYHITLLNPDGSGAGILTTPPYPDSTDGDPAWSSDGARLVFARGVSYADVYNNPDLFIINRDGSGLQRLTTTGDAYHPSWSRAAPAPGSPLTSRSPTTPVPVLRPELQRRAGKVFGPP